MNEKRTFTVKQKWGALLLDVPRLLFVLSAPDLMGGGWIKFRNRQDRTVNHHPEGGVHCLWEGSRSMHVFDVFPFVGCIFLKRVLKQFPIQLLEAPPVVRSNGLCSDNPVSEERPEVSFLIGHCGLERLVQLQNCLRSLAAQKGVSFECIVVEQDEHIQVLPRLPDWVRKFHQQPNWQGGLYSRSRALNAAAAEARGKILVLHDADLASPANYASEIVSRVRAGYDCIQLKRFIFYLENSSFSQEATSVRAAHLSIRKVIENLEGGGSVALTSKAFQDIGGMDEDFIGWGGEDIEFWDRCLTRSCWRWGRLPFLHLDHSDQPGKRSVRGLGLHTADLTDARRGQPVDDRIKRLRSRSLNSSPAEAYL